METPDASARRRRCNASWLATPPQGCRPLVGSAHAAAVGVPPSPIGPMRPLNSLDGDAAAAVAHVADIIGVAILAPEQCALVSTNRTQ